MPEPPSLRSVLLELASFRPELTKLPTADCRLPGLAAGAEGFIMGPGRAGHGYGHAFGAGHGPERGAGPPAPGGMTGVSRPDLYVGCLYCLAMGTGQGAAALAAALH